MFFISLKKLQAEFRERQNDFESLVEESRCLRETILDQTEQERLNDTLSKLTQCWDEYSRWAAARYQLTVLSNHYQKSSTAVVKYLDKIQTKMNTIEIPKNVVEKISEESQKAKVCERFRVPFHCYTPYHTIPYHTIPYHTIPYHTIPYHTIPYHTIPYHTIPYHTIPYHTIPYHTMNLARIKIILYVIKFYFTHSSVWWTIGVKNAKIWMSWLKMAT